MPKSTKNEHCVRKQPRETGLKCRGCTQFVPHCHVVHCHVAGVAKNGRLAFLLGIVDGFHVSADHCWAVQSVLPRMHRSLIQMLIASPGSRFECSRLCNLCVTGPFWFGVTTSSAHTSTKVHMFPDIGLPPRRAPNAGCIQTEVFCSRSFDRPAQNSQGATNRCHILTWWPGQVVTLSVAPMVQI